MKDWRLPSARQLLAASAVQARRATFEVSAAAEWGAEGKSGAAVVLCWAKA